jgi:hypothetical protein
MLSGFNPLRSTCSNLKIETKPDRNPEIHQKNSTSEQKNLTLGLATLALSIATASTTQAALINGVTATTNMGELIGSSITNIVNGSGLPGNIPSLTGTHVPGNVPNIWIGNLSTGNLITFNLSGTYSLAGFSLWNYNGGSSSLGVNGVNVLSSTDGTNFTSVSGAPTQFAIGTNAISESPELFSFAPVTASYVRFQVLSNYGSSFTGLSEVQFNSASATAVPEPFTVLGTLAGLGGGAALKRRLRGVKSKAE